MRQNLLGGLSQPFGSPSGLTGSSGSSVAGRLPEADRYAHGGNVWKLAERAGIRPEELLDFSASINPLGPPPWLPEVASDALSQVGHYPDPEAGDLTLAACELYKVWPTQALAGNGASELLPAVCALAARQGFTRAIIPVPAYVDMDRCCRLAGLSVEPLLCTAQNAFAPDLEALAARLGTPALVLLTSPNNPTGTCVPARHVRDLARAFPKSLFVVDESFADFVPGIDDEGTGPQGGGNGRLVRQRPDNVIVLVSMTKFYAVPGLRLGLCFASPDNTQRLRRRLPAWNVGTLAQRVGARCLRDLDYRSRTIREVASLRETLTADLREIPGLRVFPGAANFLLCRLDRVGMSAVPLFERLLSEGLAVRLCKNFEGLDDSYFRVAVRARHENARLVDALARFSGIVKAPAAILRKKTPALMIQGTCSNAGKSVLAAGLCRILLEDGFDVAPFKAQNMSNNSAVTPDGREIGRAQATQAQACRLSPDARMNPVLLKPTGETGSQVLLLGRPVGAMNVQQYHAYKPEAWRAVTSAYDSLSAEHQIMVLEGAGSPAEVNLKDHDIVNMKMARHAQAKVLLVGDIDRGGVFAALAGTFDILDEAERALVVGHVLNKFRGDASILGPALDFLYRRTGRPVLGTVPWLPRLDLPEEDSVGLGNTASGQAGKRPDALDVAVITPERIANFNDLDPLAAEPDVRLRLVQNALDLGAPDLVILPGSKNTIDDMRALRGAGFAAALRACPASTRIVGICAGLQMLGLRVDDPLRLESGQKSAEGFGLLPLSTELKREKTLTRVTLADPRSGQNVTGYEIHHGQTRLEDQGPGQAGRAVAVLCDSKGRALAYGLDDETLAATGFSRVWGTYLHGVFDDDGFRRAFLDALRQGKGLPPLREPQTRFGLEPGLERLAKALRQHLDMGRVYQALGLARPGGLLG